MSGARAHLFGVEIDRLGMDETVSSCRELIESRRFSQQVSINAAKVVSLYEDPRLRAIVRRCALVNADGQSIVWASRLLRDPVPTRVAGIDLMERLLELAAREQYPVFILGARREVLARAVAVLRGRYPALPVAGYRDGYFSDGENAAVCDEIRASGARILFVAMGSPTKEYWIDDHRDRLGVNLAMGVGGAIDVVAGVTRRAPLLLQRMGLEWTARVWQEPSRMIRRYTVTNARFLAIFTRELHRRALAR
ncbi:MAG: WecB/TagA/CpsF family glycosyltransferase [Actinomycetota bacterium]|nr:WecB/TagA/CpsF family glycosyltransferase [Actinomycetota bacterium]